MAPKKSDISTFHLQIFYCHVHKIRCFTIFLNHIVFLQMIQSRVPSATPSRGAGTSWPWPATPFSWRQPRMIGPWSRPTWSSWMQSWPETFRRIMLDQSSSSPWRSSWPSWSTSGWQILDSSSQLPGSWRIDSGIVHKTL